MAFDMATAQPTKKGFDISSAKPIDSPEGFPGASVIEPALAVGSGAAAMIGGGIAGIAQTLNPFAEEGAGAQAVEDVQGLAFTPKTEEGKAGLKTLGDLVQRGIDLANIPISGLGGIIELISNQGVDQAVETIRKVQEQGAGKTAGERVFEETGSPLAATVAETTPEAIASLLGTKGASKAIPAAGRGIQAMSEGALPAAQAVKSIGKELLNLQTPTKQRIARLIDQGSTDVETAKFKLMSPEGVPENPTRLQEFLRIGEPKVKADPIAVESIKQGFDEGVIAAVKGSSPADKLKMQEMVNIMERGKKNALYATQNRPSDVAGNTLLDRVKTIRTANRNAGRDIDQVAASLRGQSVDILESVSSFGAKLDDLGVHLAPNGQGGFTPDFSLSQLSPGDRGPLREVIRQMNIRGSDGFDALDVHKMKRIIDNNVTFGKVKTGMSGDAERALKGFRAELDNALDTKFPEYNKVNTVYSETIGALNSIQDVAGRKMDLSGGNADKALGTLLRRTLSNAQSRVRLIDSIDEIEAVSRKYGGDDTLSISGSSLGRDDLLTQVLFVDELDSVFGPVARTSFQGQIDQALKQGVNAATTKAGAVDAALNVAGKAAERVRGINEEGAFKSIKKLLGE